MLAEWNLNAGYNIIYNSSDVFNPYDFMDNGSNLVYDYEIEVYYVASTYNKIQTSNSNIKQNKNMKCLYVVDFEKNEVKVKDVTKFAN